MASTPINVSQGRRPSLAASTSAARQTPQIDSSSPSRPFGNGNYSAQSPFSISTPVHVAVPMASDSPIGQASPYRQYQQYQGSSYPSPSYPQPSFPENSERTPWEDSAFSSGSRPAGLIGSQMSRHALSPERAQRRGGPPLPSPSPRSQLDFQNRMLKCSSFLPAIALFALEALLGYLLYKTNSKPLFILFGICSWLIGLCIHEFSHAVVAYIGGDHTVAEKGYLSMNITKYTSLFQSIVVPVAMLLLGGIGLPGGAVFVRHDLLRSKLWESAVSIAGPFSGLLVAAAYAYGFQWIREADIQGPHQLFYYGLGFSTFFMVTSTFLNLLPLPPLDGYGVVSPWLPRPLKEAIERPNVYALLSILSTFIIFMLFWKVSALTNLVIDICEKLGVPKWVIGQGLQNFRIG